MKYLIIIPARGGSKGIINKNIKKINNLPLIEYTIFPALSVKHIFNDIEIIVSTDSKKIKNISLKAGANVPFLRPKNISNDFAPSRDYVDHAIRYFNKLGKYPLNIIILQPTSPLRTKEDIINSIKIFEKNNCESLISVYKENYINNNVTYKSSGKFGIPKTRFHNQGIRRQEEAPSLIRNGAIYIFNVEYFKKTKKIISNKPLIYVMQKSKSVNIDNQDDLDLVIKLLRKNSNSK